jgi:hypothetical protein
MLIKELLALAQETVMEDLWDQGMKICDKIYKSLKDQGVKCNLDVVQDLFMGGGRSNGDDLHKFMNEIEKLGFEEDYSSYAEIKPFLDKVGVTKAEFNTLVKASQ